MISMKLLKYLLLCLCVLCGCSTTIVDDDFIVDRISGIEEITYDALVEKIENNHDFILYIGRSDCSDCKEFAPYLENFLKENDGLGLYYLDVKAFRDQANSDTASKEEKDFFKNIYTTLDFDWTPTLQHRRGQTILTKITYLSMDYYEIEDETLQETEQQQNLNDIYAWLEKECE